MAKIKKFTLYSIPKVEVSTIPVDGLFEYKKQVWRSLGKLAGTSHSTTAQRVSVNKYGTEVVEENADFIDCLKVRPYDGDLPDATTTRRHSPSQYQSKIDSRRVH